jgi:hypothetical protein
MLDSDDIPGTMEIFEIDLLSPKTILDAVALFEEHGVKASLGAQESSVLYRTPPATLRGSCSR